MSYKQRWQGRRVIVVCRWYPSSQECHICHERTQHTLSVRQWTCAHCGTAHDRDHNAALNLESAGLHELAGGNPERQNVCGEGVRPSKRRQPLRKQKASTAR